MDKKISIILARKFNFLVQLSTKIPFIFHCVTGALFFLKWIFAWEDTINVFLSRFRSTKCEYLDGSCLASPRWVSLLVAEIYYPDATFPNPANANPSQNRSPVQGVNPPNVSLTQLEKLKQD